jgi:hypothetical protein
VEPTTEYTWIDLRHIATTLKKVLKGRVKLYANPCVFGTGFFCQGLEAEVADEAADIEMSLNPSREMIEHLKAHAPNEACGSWPGRTGGSSASIP